MTKFKNFEEFKAEVVRQGELSNMCDAKSPLVYNLMDYESALQTLKDNLRLSFLAGMFRVDVIERIPDNILKNADIHVNEDCNSGFCIADNGNINIKGNAIVYAYDDVTIVANDEASINAYDKATVIGNNEVKIRCFDRSLVEVSDKCFVVKFDNSTVKASCDSVVASKSGSNIVLSEDAKFKKIK